LALTSEYSDCQDVYSDYLAKYLKIFLCPSLGRKKAPLEGLSVGETMTKKIQSNCDDELKPPAHETDEDWNLAWSKEAAARMAEFKAGKVEAIDADDVFDEL
jgi:hypothetical protein